MAHNDTAFDSPFFEKKNTILTWIYLFKNKKNKPYYVAWSYPLAYIYSLKELQI